MKKLICALAFVPVVAMADLKVATVDLLKLVRNHPDYDRNEKFMESKSKDLQKKGDAIKSEGESLQTEGKKLYEQMRNPMLNEKAKSETEKKLMDIQQKLMQIEQRYRSEMMRGNQELQEDRGRLLKATTDDLRQRIAKYAEKQGLDMIIDANAAVYSKKSFDVTPAILKDMGVDPAKAKDRGDNEGK